MQVLPTDERNLYGCSLQCVNKGGITSYPACVITGWPVLTVFGGNSKSTLIEFKKGVHYANKDDWLKIIMTAKTVPSTSPIMDVLRFINDWCGSPPSFAFQ